MADTEPLTRYDWIGGPIMIVALSVGLFFLIRTVVYDLQPIDTRSFTRVHGVVEAADEYGVGISYDDGRRWESLGPVGETYPEVGTRVLLERWHGRFVSAFDPVTEHRYRGSKWPGMVSDWVPFAFFFDLLVLGALLYVIAQELVRRKRAAMT